MSKMNIREWVLKQFGYTLEAPPSLKFMDGDLHLHFHINLNLKEMFRREGNGKDTE